MTHPARYSPEVLDVFREVLNHAWPDWFGRPLLHDPFAGSGERLHAFCRSTDTDGGWSYTGTELEGPYIEAPGIHQGDSRDAETYPPHLYPGREWVILTSPVYPNGMCLAQEHVVLTRDLHWVPVGDLVEGDELLTFDEFTEPKANGHASRRRFQWGEVISSRPATVDCVRVILADGTEVVCTPEHPWLADRYGYSSDAARFVEARNLMGTGSIPRGRSGHHGHVWVKRQFDTWSSLRSYDAGWLAGMFDGEGHLILPRSKTALKLGLTQRLGPIQDQIERTLSSLGVEYATYSHSRDDKVVQTEIQGGLSSILELLGSIRSERLINKWVAGQASDSVTQAKAVEVVAVEPAGKRDIQRLCTSTGTYIGEGFLMHNSDNHLARDDSRRKNYRKAKADIVGDPEAALEAQNMGNFGYRGTKRPEDGGKSVKRTEYWRIARECVENWQTASMVLVNVSDFMHSGGVVEPVVDDWRKLLHEAGWTDQTVMPVGTRRMKDGANADQRVDHEVVIVGRKG